MSHLSQISPRTNPARSAAADVIPFQLSAIVLALSLGSASHAADVPKSTASKEEITLAPVVVKEQRLAPEGRDGVQAKVTTIGKGKQDVRDVPQSLTVVTEKLIDDRNLDTLKEVLHNTAGVTFLAAEGGEEDIRLRGFSLAATGDIFADGMRDPAFYDRDTFNNDRVELLRGSASMLFGRGSTGGAVNQVSKQPMLDNSSEATATLGSYNYLRLVGDANIQTGNSSALRITAMSTTADNNGSGSRIEKKGFAPVFTWGIYNPDEFSVGFYYLKNDNGMNYGMPWIRPSSSAPINERALIPRDPSNYYGAESDYSAGGATYGTFSHTHRFSPDTELKTVVRKGSYERDQRASTIRFVNANTFLDNLNDATPLRRGNNNKIQEMDTLYAQSDFSSKFAAFGLNHAVLTGIDYAHEEFTNYNASAPTGTTKPNTTLGRPDDGGSVDEGRRVLTVGRTFDAKAFGFYGQDLLQVAKDWKVLLGLRYDNFKGRYWGAATTNAQGVVTAPAVTRSRSDALWSKRFGVLYQPSQRASFHFSYGTSFNTSGDTYQYDNQTANTGPEGSVNLELGARLDAADGKVTTRLALFHSTKNNERNRDPDSAATAALLSGKRHSAGVEIDITGRITSEWEVFGSYAWTPIARIDIGAPGSVAGVGEGAGTRSSLTPRHSGTVWSTYQLTRFFRFGGGLNFRSEQTPNRNPGWAAPSFVTGDLMAEYTIDRYAIKANISNVTNKLYADALYSGHYIPGAGRNIQVTLGAKF